MSAPHLLLYALDLVPTLPHEGFRAIAARDGVTVYQHDSREGLALGAEGRIDAPPDAVRAALTDYERAPRWVHGVAESRVLERSATSLHVYQRLKLPLVSDRDFTLYAFWGADGDTKWLRFSIDNDRGPAPTKGAVRVYVNKGSWRLHAVDGGRATYAVYEFTLGMGGSLPSWLGRGSAAKEIVGLFEGLRAEARKAR